MAIEGYGKTLPEHLNDLLALRCALIVWDMQEGIARRAQGVDRVISSTASLLAAARERGVPVIYAQHTELPFEWEAPGFLRAQWRRSGKARPVDLPRPLLPGTDAWQIIPELAPGPVDVVLQKYRISFFSGSPLTDILAANRIETLLLTGVATDRGVVSTAREAADAHGLFPVVITDACAGFTSAEHEKALLDATAFADCATSGDVLAAWAS